MAASLQSRKQELVRNTIYDAAIELFAQKGFDETTVEEVANAASVSRRSFFRYFASKDDLLAQSVVSYGNALATAIASCPPAMSPLEVIRETVMFGAKHTALQPRTRQTIEISLKSFSARQAHQSRLIEVEDLLAGAFAARMKGPPRDGMKPRMFAGLTLLLMNLTIYSWFTNEYGDLSISYRQSFAALMRLICEDSAASTMPEESLNDRIEQAGATKRRTRS